jgi:hypothetical protein
MIATIHQPNYLPWLGFFDKIKRSDILVILDTAKFVEDDFQQRNKIRTSSKQGWMWLTIPIPKDCHDVPINKVKMADSNWKQEHWKSVQHFYARTPYFESYSKFFQKIYRSDIKNLSEFNIEIIKYLISAFNINSKVFVASEMPINHSLKSTDMLIEIINRVGATHYISGKSGKNYMDETKFKDAGIGIEYQNYRHPEYPQAFSGFIPCMSAIDLLFNCGEKSSDII